MLSSLYLKVPKDILSTLDISSSKTASLPMYSSIDLGVCLLIQWLQLVTLADELVSAEGRESCLSVVAVEVYD